MNITQKEKKRKHYVKTLGTATHRAHNAAPVLFVSFDVDVTPSFAIDWGSSAGWAAVGGAGDDVAGVGAGVCGVVGVVVGCWGFCSYW